MKQTIDAAFNAVVTVATTLSLQNNRIQELEEEVEGLRARLEVDRKFWKKEVEKLDKVVENLVTSPKAAGADYWYEQAKKENARVLDLEAKMQDLLKIGRELRKERDAARVEVKGLMQTLDLAGRVGVTVDAVTEIEIGDALVYDGVRLKTAAVSQDIKEVLGGHRDLGCEICGGSGIDHRRRPPVCICKVTQDTAPWRPLEGGEMVTTYSPLDAGRRIDCRAGCPFEGGLHSHYTKDLL